MKTLPAFFGIALLTASASAADAIAPIRGLREVPHEQVELRGGFWGTRLKIHHDVTIPHALDELEKDGHVTNFDKAAGKFDGPRKGHHAFDSDLHKTLEGACYALAHDPSGPLRERTEDIFSRIIAAQKPDGFLISYFIIKDFEKRWEMLRLEHQMYNAGHFFEAAVAHQRLTGQARILDSARRFADNLDSTFGPNKIYDVDGHEEVELALIKLYRATGERRYLDLARFFLDERGYAHGTEHKPFDPTVVPPEPKIELSMTEAEVRRAKFHAVLMRRNGRMQDHKPIIEQMEAIGHAVRAGYLYSAMADMVRFSDAPGYEKALDSIWNDVVGRKMYLTGGIGTGQYEDEGFGDPYLLPNESAYCETCAAIAHVLWQHRMALLKADAKYADVMELALYNGVLPGVSLSGDLFRYENPLSSEQGDTRRKWIGLSCCPTNLARIIPQVGGLMYAVGKNEIFVNLYAAGEANIPLAEGKTFKLVQETEYPWEGKVRITIKGTADQETSIALRIPGWAQGRPVPSDLYTFADAKPVVIELKVNGKSLDATPGKDGYVHLKRISWNEGDIIELNIPMPVQRVHAHEKVAADRDKVALMRGPIVYCVEAADNGQDVSAITLPRHWDFGSKLEKNPLLGTCLTIGPAANIKGEVKEKQFDAIPFTAIPSFAWGNRAKGSMAVWLNELTPPSKDGTPK